MHENLFFNEIHQSAIELIFFLPRDRIERTGKEFHHRDITRKAAQNLFFIGVEKSEYSVGIAKAV